MLAVSSLPVTAGCGLTDRSAGVSFADGPAECAGPDRARYSRDALWAEVADDDKHREIAVSLARTRTPDDLARAIDEELAVTGVLVVFRAAQGGYIKAFDRVSDEPAAGGLSQQIARMLNRGAHARTGPHAPADPEVLERGEYPIGAFCLKGDRGALAAWVDSHKCDVWGLAPVSNSGHPMLSPAVDPT